MGPTDSRHFGDINTEGAVGGIELGTTVPPQRLVLGYLSGLLPWSSIFSCVALHHRLFVGLLEMAMA